MKQTLKRISVGIFGVAALGLAFTLPTEETPPNIVALNNSLKISLEQQADFMVKYNKKMPARLYLTVDANPKYKPLEQALENGLKYDDSSFRLLEKEKLGDFILKKARTNLLDNDQMRQDYIDLAAEIWQRPIAESIFSDSTTLEQELQQLEAIIPSMAAAAEFHAAEPNSELYYMNFYNRAALSQTAYVHFVIKELPQFVNPTINDVVVVLPRSVVRLGDAVYAEIGLGSTQSNWEGTASINGRTLKGNSNRFDYQAKPMVEGEQRLEAAIMVRSPLTGREETFSTDFYYFVLPK